MMEWLKKILEGAEVTDGALNAEALQNTIEKEFPKYAIPKTQFNEVNEKLKTANETIEQLKKDNQDNELLQQQVNAYKTKVEELETAAADTQKEYALREKLQEAGAVDPEYLIYKQGGLEKFAFDKDGKPVGIDDLLKPLKESSPHLFKNEQRGGYEPRGGGKPSVSNPFAKETWNLTKQGEILRSNPTQAAELAAAAGVKL